MGLVLLGTGDVIQLGAIFVFTEKLALLLCQYYQVKKP